jgi:TonB family protein
MYDSHARIEAIAGAIALGEATDEERREYREHLAACPECLNALGGEREIERVAETVTVARESEVWQPDLGDVVSAHARRRNHRLQIAGGFAALCAVFGFGVHAFLTTHFSTPSGAPVVINAGATSIVLEQRAAVAAKPALPTAAPRRLIVEHNVVQIARAPLSVDPVAVPAKPDRAPRDLVQMTVHPEIPAPTEKPPRDDDSNVPIWRRGDTHAWRTVATTTTTSLIETAPQTLTHSAELMQVSAPHTMRDATPVGGTTAINPQPPPIAYDMGAEGTSVFEVLIDDRGNPTKCVITKSSGYVVLDNSVCKAAMQTRYLPKLIDGRAVAGVYRDAFTFRMSDDQNNVEGVPKQIQRRKT